MIRIGTAGWVVPRHHAELCAGDGSHLERYSRVLNCVEVNSTFYRSHAAKVWTRWMAATPEEFRFAVKAPKAITHEAKLVNCGGALQKFFSQVSILGEKLGPVLIQLPPKLAFEEEVAREFFGVVRELHNGPVVCEPRHESWFGVGPSRLLVEYEVARVSADPPKGSAQAAKPGGWNGLRYYRLHGSPRMYWSEYGTEYLARLADDVKKHRATETWVIFDNTAQGHALHDAVELRGMLGSR